MYYYIVRHGQTEWNLQHRTQGHCDSALTPTGVEQAVSLGNRLASTSIDAVFSSSLNRARRTAGLIGEQHNPPLSPTPDDRLREMYFGTWEGMTIDEIRSGYPREYETYRQTPELFRAPNGESFAEMHQRISGFFSEMQRLRTGSVLIVTHAICARVCIVTLMKQPISTVWSVHSVPPASLTTIRVENGSAEVIDIANIEHLNSLNSTQTADR